MALKIRLSISSSPFSSTSSALKAIWAISLVIVPSPFIWAKSLVRLNKLLAIRGVPRLRLAISKAALSTIGEPRIEAERLMILVSSVES